MRIRLPDDDSRRLEELLSRARTHRGRHVSASAWIRGAIDVALGDDDIAEKIAASAPETGHGGAREGAGRPARRAGPEQGE